MSLCRSCKLKKKPRSEASFPHALTDDGDRAGSLAGVSTELCAVNRNEARLYLNIRPGERPVPDVDYSFQAGRELEVAGRELLRACVKSNVATDELQVGYETSSGNWQVRYTGIE